MALWRRRAWATEVDRRVAELDSGAVQTVPWAEVRCRLGSAPRPKFVSAFHHTLGSAVGSKSLPD
jgi:Putative addiction module component